MAKARKSAKNKPPVIGPEKQNIKLYPQAGDNKEFVQQLENLKKVGPGGAREGAGRPAGSTDKVIAAEKMGTAANPAIIGLLKIPFELWAQLTKLDSMSLTDKEVELLGVPATQLVNYYMPVMDNPVYLAWASLIGAASYIMLPRFYQLKKIRDEKATVKAGVKTGTDALGGTDAANAGQNLQPDKQPTGPSGFPVEQK
jgi:hypothetical protein